MAILSILSFDFLDAADDLQLCASQVVGTKSAVHSVRSLFGDSEAVSVKNMFTSPNRFTAMLCITYYLSVHF